MFEFTGLRELHKNMKLKGEKRSTFTFEYKQKGFSCIFLTDIIPYRLYLTTLGESPLVFEFEIKNYQANAYMDNDDYKKLVKYLDLKYDPNFTFSPKAFLEVLNSKIPHEHKCSPNYKDVLIISSKKRKIDEEDKIFFCGWKRNTGGDHVRETNLEKTKSAFGEEMEKICKQNNISSRWTDIEKDEDLRRLNQLASM